MYVKSKCTIPANHSEYFIMGAKYHYLPPVRHPPPLEATLCPALRHPREFAAGDSPHREYYQHGWKQRQTEGERERTEREWLGGVVLGDGRERDGWKYGTAGRREETNDRPVDSCRAYRYSEKHIGELAHGRARTRRTMGCATGTKLRSP